MPDPLATLAGRRNRARGAFAETIVCGALTRRGIIHAVVETGWRVQRRGNHIVGAVPLRPVIGDLVACVAGRLVLVEVKREDGPTLSLSRLADHQRATLTRWQLAGALCVVAWVRSVGPLTAISWIRWPSSAWLKGAPLRWEDAWEQDDIEELTDPTRTTP